MVHDVAGDDRLAAAGRNANRNMPGRVPRSRLEKNFGSYSEIGLHQLSQPGIDNGLDRILLDGAVLLAHRLRPELELGAREKVARLGKGRRPAAVLEHRVPADMVDVQVRAKHDVDR